MDGQVPEEVKRERMERLVERIQCDARARNAALVGTVQEVLIEGPSRTDPTTSRGRTRTNKTAIVEGSPCPGSLVDVLVTDSTSQTLRGRPARVGAAA